VSVTRHEAWSAIRVLREGGWASGLLAVIGLSVVFALLGQWQYGRHEEKVARRDLVEANYDATPVPLADVRRSPGESLDPARQWLPVLVSGRYLTEATVLVRNRPLDGSYGFEVLVPLRLEDSSILMIDRGWVPNGRTGAAPDAVPPPPPGTVQVTARLRPGEPALDRTPPAGQQLRIDLARISAQIGEPVHQAYGVLVQEQPEPAGRITLLPRPATGLGPHLAYAVQWWGFAAAAYGVLAHYALREARRRAGVPRPVGRPAAGRQLSDEEWEDLADR
jgi:cytochrome oxidase assembly protein ShyY1